MILSIIYKVDTSRRLEVYLIMIQGRLQVSCTPIKKTASIFLKIRGMALGF